MKDTAAREENAKLKEDNAVLKHRLEQLERIIFGQKSEKTDPERIDGQSTLFDTEEYEVGNIEEIEVPAHTRKKQKKHPGRNAFPSHLPVQEEVLEPEEDTTGMEKIGEEVTETLEYKPADLYIRRRIRPKYARPKNQGVVIASLPSRPIEKGIAEASLLSHLFISKFCDHLPFYRQRQIFMRKYQWDVAASTLNSWFVRCCTLMKPLYRYMGKEILKSEYIQVDETPLKVQDVQKQGKTHRGYQWVYQSPEKKIVYFQYDKTRSMSACKKIISRYNGILQCDGYVVYDKIAAKTEIEFVGCLAHARRKFYEAKSNEPQGSKRALQFFRVLYSHEKEVKALKSEGKLEEAGEIREQKSMKVMKEFKKWIGVQAQETLPKSVYGKALQYTINQWPKLRRAVANVRVEIDNNLIENKIRPLALGRKNYLFAGSHAGAERIAMMYTFIGTCIARNVNPYEWMKETLERLPTTQMIELYTLMPGYQET